MKFSVGVVFLLLGCGVLSDGSAAESPESVVRQLYQQVVRRKPLGIPKGEDKTAIAPFLSTRLFRTLDTAQSCEDDYRGRHSDPHSKPEFNWLEFDLFSGANEKAISSEAKVERQEKETDGSFRVYVRLTYKESFDTYEKPPSSANSFDWIVAAVVVLQSGRPVVDDVLFFTDDSTKIYSRLSEYFRGCEGSRWVGDKM